jgi:hypothetical protein
MRCRVIRLCVVLLSLAWQVPLRGEESLAEAVADPAWDRVFDRSEGWIGGDAIYSVPLPDGDILWLFADTYLGRASERRRQPGTRMVNNTLARHALAAAGSAPDPQSVRFLWGSPPDAVEPKAWIEPDPALMPADGSAAHEWYWVADGIVAPRASGGERLILFLWRIARTGDDVFGFRGAGCALATIDNLADDWTVWRPKQFKITHVLGTSSDQRRRPPEIAWGSEVLLHVEPDARQFLLIYGYRQPFKAATKLVLARAPADAVEQMQRWQFRTADGWSPRLDDAASLAEGVTTEFSVTRLEAPENSLWVLVQSEPWFGTRILARTALTPFGPWSAAKPVYQVPSIDPKKKHFTYAAKAHPELSRPGELLVSYVVNSFDFAESSTNADIYRPRFVRVPVGVLPRPKQATK